MRIFPHHKLLKKKNLRKFERKLKNYFLSYNQRETDYDRIYDFLEGWYAYAKHANTYMLRRRITEEFEIDFKREISTKEINRKLKETRRHQKKRKK